MFKYIIKLSIRNFHREKIYALINVTGLSLAVTCCIILGLYLRGELTYDLHHENHDRLYRVAAYFKFSGSGQADLFSVTGVGFGPLIAGMFDEVESYVRFTKNPPSFFSYKNKVYEWDKVYNADDNIFKIFSHDIIYGDPETALVEPQDIAVSETFARTYFGEANPIGEIINGDNGQPFKISLVFADLPENTHLKYDVLLSNNSSEIYSQNENYLIRSLNARNIFTYLLMSENFRREGFSEMSDIFVQKYHSSRAEYHYWLQPLADIHYDSTSNLRADEPKGNRSYLYALVVVSLFILIVSCINYTNLATARSMRRSREVGMRKILGANKNQLILQYIIEAIFYVTVAVVIGVLLGTVILNSNLEADLFGKSLNFNIIKEPRLIGWLALLAVAVGMFAGIYPALYLSSWAPLTALVKSGKNASRGNYYIRQALVLVQFTISISVIAATLSMFNQMQYISNKALGFNKENQVVIRLLGADLVEQYPVIKNKLLQYPNVLGVSLHEKVLGQTMIFSGGSIKNQDGIYEPMTFASNIVDYDYLDVMSLEIVSGRNFSEDYPTDRQEAVIVNESFVKAMGWKDPLVNRVGKQKKVIGVVKDFHFNSLHNAIGPMTIQPDRGNYSSMPSRIRPFITRYLTAKITGDDISNTLAYMEDTMKEHDTTHPFEYSFLDDRLNALYNAEQRLMTLLGIFASICILISILGLYGLMSFITEQRFKEMSIRKVLGASTVQNIYLISKGIIWIVLFGAVIASIISYLAIESWLSNFAYRDSISNEPFILAMIITMVLACITMSAQSYKAMQANPVDYLREE